jgi:hypothetical protein
LSLLQTKTPKTLFAKATTFWWNTERGENFNKKLSNLAHISCKFTQSRRKPKIEFLAVKPNSCYEKPRKVGNLKISYSKG